MGRNIIEGFEQMETVIEPANLDAPTKIPGERGLFSEILSVVSKGEKLDLTQGSISRTIWIIAIPQIVTNLMQSLFNVVDMFWVGRLGSESIAAVAIAGTVMLVLFTAIMGVGIGASAMVARAIGRQDFKWADLVTVNAIWLALLISVPVALLGYFNSEWLFHKMGAEGEVLTIGSHYLQILFANCAVIFLTFVINAVMQGTGDALTPMVIMTGALAVNAVVDPCLIFGWGPFPRLGVAGAAWSTVLSRAIACVLFLFALRSGKLRLRFRIRKMVANLNWGLNWSILRLGFPASLQLSIRGVMGIVLMSLVTPFGTAAVAAYGIGYRLFSLGLFPGFGFGVAAAGLVGQNLGAGKPDRSSRSAYYTVGYYVAFLSLIILAFGIIPKNLVAIFDKNPEVIDIGATMLQTVALGLPFVAVSLILNRSLGGAGDTISPLVITLISLWGLQIPLAAGLSKLESLGVVGVFWAGTIAQIAGAAMAYWHFKKGHWKKIKI